MNQDESVTNNDDGGLYTVMKNIFKRPCSKGYLCIELGSIFGDFNEKIQQKVKIKKEKIHVIAKPIVIANNIPKPVDEKKHHDNKNKTDLIIINDEDDCDEFNWDHYYEPPRFKVK